MILLSLTAVLVLDDAAVVDAVDAVEAVEAVDVVVVVVVVVVIVVVVVALAVAVTVAVVESGGGTAGGGVVVKSVWMMRFSLLLLFASATGTVDSTGLMSSPFVSKIDLQVSGSIMAIALLAAFECGGLFTGAEMPDMMYDAGGCC